MAKLVVLFITAFVDMVGFALVLPLLPYYAKEYGATALLVGVLVSSFSVAQLAMAPLWGRASDRYGRRPMIIAGLALSAVAYAVFAFAGSVWLLLLSRVVQGMGGGTIGVVQAYVADATPPDQRTRSLGWLSAVTSLGAVVGPAFGSILDQAGGQRAPGLAAAALATLIAVFAWRFLRESREMRPPGAIRAASRTGAVALRRVLSHPREPASRLIWIYAIAIGAFYGTGPTMPLLLSARLGVTEHTIGYFFMYFGAMGVIARAGLLGWVLGRLGEARLSRLGIGLLAAGLCLLSVARSYPVLMASMTLMPLGTAFLFPCVTGLLSQVVPGTDRGLYMGVQQTFGGVSRVAFPVAAGYAMDQFGYGTPFLAAAVMVLITLPLTSAMAGYAAAQCET
ncbi:MAG TPA: MFS transporter [Gemmatimonadales bacterium]|nr:MFS transporter [Gemmatimonadales bacterium]